MAGLLGGSQEKHNRQINLSAVPGMQNLFNWGISTGKAATDPAVSYWKGILSGNRPAMLQAAAPEINAATSSADAAKRQIASAGTARGGGVAGQNRTIDDQTRALIANNLFGARGKAATASAATGANVLSTAGSTGQSLFDFGGGRTGGGSSAGAFAGQALFDLFSAGAAAG
jgi:hypothetical protein